MTQQRAGARWKLNYQSEHVKRKQISILGGEKCKDLVPHSTIEREQVCNAGSLDYNQDNFYGS